jgi:nickel/cobalt transporter (NicO) family protein
VNRNLRRWPIAPGYRIFPRVIPGPISHMSLGLILGLRHAFEADHIAAVATIVSRERNPVRSGFIGGFWGLGHLASLLLVGLPVIGLGLKFPEQLNLPLELGVAAMIVFLGVGSLTRDRFPARHTHSHSLRDLGKRPFWVGAAHGLAGSGTLTLVILATMPSRTAGLLYLGLFGAGSIAGMMAASAILSIPVAASEFGGPATTRRLGRAVAFASVIFGLFYGATTIAMALARHRLS